MSSTISHESNPSATRPSRYCDRPKRSNLLRSSVMKTAGDDLRWWIDQDSEISPGLRPDMEHHNRVGLRATVLLQMAGESSGEVLKQMRSAARRGLSVGRNLSET